MPNLCRILFVIIATSLTVANAQPPQAGKFNEAIWVERLITETRLMMADKEVPQSAVIAHLPDALYTLGRHGKEEQALQLEKDSRMYDIDNPDELMLLNLADGLSSGDFVDKAIKITEQIPTQDTRDYSFKFIARTQTWQGDFESAEQITSRIQSLTVRDKSRLDTCMAYAEAGRIDDAKRLAGDPADAEVLAEIEKCIQLKEPPIADANYVESMVRIRSTIIKDKWESLNDYLRHYYSAEHALHRKDQDSFDKHSSELMTILNRYPDRHWERLDVADQFYRNGNIEQARPLYSYVLKQFASNTEAYQLSSTVHTLLTSLRKKPSAENIPFCFSAHELEAMTNTYINNMATWDMAAALLALAIKVDNAAWAEAIYQDHPSPQFKAKVASYILYKLI